VPGVTTKVVREPKYNFGDIEVTPLDGAPKTRYVVRADGPLHVADASVHDNNLANALRALRERVFCVEGRNGLEAPPRPRPGAFRRLHPFRAAVVRRMGPCHEVSVEEFLSHYTGAKLKRYTEAAQALQHHGLHKKHAYLSSFVKAEFINIDTKPDPCSRIIQPRSAVFNLCVGRFVIPMEKRMYRAIDKVFGSKTVAKGLTAQEVAGVMRRHWDGLADPVAVCIDASRFDQHVSVEALQFEHSTYVSALAVPSERKKLAHLLGMQIANKGFVNLPEATIKYKVEGCRMSGDMNTSLGNCYLMCGMVWHMFDLLGLHPRAVNNGDDCVLFVERHDLARLQQTIPEVGREFGFKLIVEPPVFEFEQIEFCQSRPVLLADGWIMVRNPWVAPAKDTCMKHPPNGGGVEKAYRRWCASVADCGIALTGGVPVFQSMYLALRRNGAKGKLSTGCDFERTGLAWQAAGMTRSAQPVLPEVRFSMWMAWGMLPDLQVMLERCWEVWVLAGERDHVGGLTAFPVLRVDSEST
jgi:hypothetical protein